MKQIIEFGKLCVRSILLWTPIGRRWYARRKELQHQAVLDAVQRHGEEIIAKVFRVCKQQEIPAMLIFGTLLGCVRDGALMKHDDDIDIAVLPSKDIDMMRMIKELESVGLHFFWAWECEGYVTEIAFTYCNVHVDFYFLAEKDGKYVSHWYTPVKGVQYPSKKHWSTIECSLPVVTDVVNYRPTSFSTDVMIPKNFDDVLSTHYGAWRVPDPDWKASTVGKEHGNRKMLQAFGRMLDIDGLRELLCKSIK